MICTLDRICKEAGLTVTMETVSSAGGGSVLIFLPNGNPVKYTDPDGLFFGLDDAIGSAIQCWQDGDWDKFGERFASNFVNSWKLLGNTFNTFHDINSVGDFLKGVGEFVGRFTTGLPSTMAGFLWGWLYGIEGKGGKVDHSYLNQSIITIDDGRTMAMTIGYVTIGPLTILNPEERVWRAHEYGHYIISLLTNIFYLFHGIESMLIPDNDPNYYNYRTEKDADRYGGVKRDSYGNRYVP
jgi:hypothetical protein